MTCYCDAHAQDRPPLISIVLPTYNRASMLPDAFQSIATQTEKRWELIVVDDGSRDQTAAVVMEASRRMNQPIRYLYQPNRGAYAARNAGVLRSRGRYIAFFDSDDLWKPWHLARCLEAFTVFPALDWIYSDCEKIRKGHNAVVTRSFFREGGPHPFLRLRTHRRGAVHAFSDSRVVAFQLRWNLRCLLQSSLVRRRVFDELRFVDAYRNEGEDELFPSRAMKNGFRLGYLDEVHLRYQIHDANSSAVGLEHDYSKRLRIELAAIRGYEEFAREYWQRLTALERRYLFIRLGNEYFWKLGYALHHESGAHADALRAFFSGLRYQPWNLSMWKTFALRSAVFAVRTTRRKALRPLKYCRVNRGQGAAAIPAPPSRSRTGP